MKKQSIIIFILLFCTFLSINAQKDSTQSIIKIEDKPEVFRDRLIVDIYNTFWMNMPNQYEMDYMKFNPGISVSALWDFKIPAKKTLSFGIGLGCTYHSQFSNALLINDPNDTTSIMRYMVIDTNLINYSLNRVNYINCNIPLEFRYRHANGFKFTVGVRFGINAEISQTYKGEDPKGTGDNVWYKNYRLNHKEKFMIDVYARIGWKFINVYYSYQPFTLFEKGYGPQISPMSLGISLSIF